MIYDRAPALCVNCEHHDPITKGVCLHPLLVSPVDGMAADCYEQRTADPERYPNACGHRGQYWAAKAVAAAFPMLPPPNAARNGGT